jgi:hypothetical protein
LNTGDGILLNGDSCMHVDCATKEKYPITFFAMPCRNEAGRKRKQ